LKAKEREALLTTLKDRFEKNLKRHKGIEWAAVVARLEAFPKKLDALQAMESTGGEPDVIGLDNASGEFLYCDCSAESPEGRRSYCYDADALSARKENKPAHSAVAAAAEMGIELLTEEQYRELHKLGKFDLKTSSWLQTPAEIRKLGGAIFGDFRYATVFIYHNGVQSYYAARGFRGMLKV
jgi:hypothetical protein